jgi:hypothetical protein
LLRELVFIPTSDWAGGIGRLSRVEIVLPHLRRRKRLSAKAGLRALETKWLSDLNRMARDSARTL